MTYLVLLVTLFFPFTAWADEPDLSQFETRLQEATSRLALTEAQQAQVKPILEKHFAAQMAILNKHGIKVGNQEDNKRLGFRQLRALRNEINENKAKIMKQLSAILSEDQMAAFEHIQAEQQERIRERFRSRM